MVCLPGPAMTTSVTVPDVFADLRPAIASLPDGSTEYRWVIPRDDLRVNSYADLTSKERLPGRVAPQADGQSQMVSIVIPEGKTVYYVVIEAGGPS